MSVTVTPVTVGAPVAGAPVPPVPRDLPASTVRRVPVVTVSAAGAPLASAAALALRAVRVRREASAPAACELEFADPPEDLRALAVGRDVVVGLDSATDALFTGDVVAVEHGYGPDGVHRVRVRCQDAAARLRERSTLRAFVDVSVADLVRELADAAGLRVEGDAGSVGGRRERLLTDGRSDLDLLTGITRRAGLWWQVDAGGGVLRVFGADGSGATASTERGAGLLEAAFDVTSVGVRPGRRVVGWDPVTGLVADASASAPGAAADAPGDAAVRGGFVTAGADAAEGLARALAGDDAARARSVRAVLVGDPALAPGARLQVGGVAADVAGEYLLLSAEHVVDGAGGYTTTVSSLPPAHLQARALLDAPSARPAITPGTVLRVDDPDGRGRVTVGLGAYDGLETPWLPVLALGAGEAKGLTVQPDVDDHVLVVHDPADPGRGVVLGGLRTAGGSEPSAGVSGGRAGAYALRLPGGQGVRVAADGDRVLLENAAGSRVELTDRGITVHSAGDLVLEAPGRGLRLRAARIDLERG
ncbi:MAG: phage baseplate assembly protein V [Kineosporiaceae bacterium]